MPRKTAEYPEWVMKHKTKGTYINKVGDKYYLYAAHSERIKGTDRVRRISDGYIGRITEEGLIRAKSKLKNPPESFEIGLSFSVVSKTSDILKGLTKSYRKNGRLIYCCSVLSFIYEKYSSLLFRNSYLNLLFADVSFPDVLSPAILTGIERGSRMIQDCITKSFGDDYLSFRSLFTDIRLLRIEGCYYISGLTDETKKISQSHGIIWEDQLWQK